ncbi:MAG TPA: serine/threonine-protein kinase [Verrucomicrobiae bacterium]|nr:serine/threonine-protein kinase [Verrucomicrobiae bacterium]
MPSGTPGDDIPTFAESGLPDPGTAADAPERDASGQRFGAYQILREIGRGGMGKVYLAARADDHFKKRVALKILRSDFSDPEVLGRFRHERQILATLSHPNIATLLDGGAGPSGEPYLVMEFIEGMPIDRYCDSRNLSISDRVVLFQKLCSAVQYIHQNLIVHRDLKPSNILVTGEGVLKLLDFGIAKLLKPELMATIVDATSADHRVMTPAYASPEQVRGEPITTASDVYSLGVILYEILTGRRPYRLRSNAPHEIARAVCEDEPDKPSTAITKLAKTSEPESATLDEISRKRASPPDKLHRRLKGDLDNILLKAMRKEPQRRYVSVEQFSEDLRRHLENLPVTAHQDSPGYRLGKFVRRYKLPVIAGAAAAAFLVAGMISTLIEARVARSERALAENRFQDVRKLARTFLFDVYDAIEDLPGSTPARSLIATTGTDYLDRLAQQSHTDAELEREVAEGYLKVADVEGNPFSGNLGESAKALENYQKALAIAARLAAAQPSGLKARRTLALAEMKLGSLLPFTGEVEEGYHHVEHAVSLYREILRAAPGDFESRLDVSHAEEALGDVAGGMQSVSLGRTDDAAAAYDRALQVLPGVSPSNTDGPKVKRAWAVLTAKLADLQLRRREPEEALQTYKSALQVAEELSSAAPNDEKARSLLPAILNKIGYTQLNTGDTRSAIESYRRAEAINETALKLDPNNVSAKGGVIVTEKNLGDLYFYYGTHEMQQALICYSRAADLLEQEIQADPQNLAARQRLSETLSYVASTLLETGQKEAARRPAQRSLSIAKELADRPNATFDHLYNYAWLAVTMDPSDLQDPAGALPYALKAVEASKGKDEFALHVLSKAYAGFGDYAHAVETEERALALFPPLQPGQHKTGQRESVERALDRYREELHKRGDKQ